MSKSKIAQFMELPKKERDRLLKEQAIESIDYYAGDEELKEFRDADLVDIGLEELDADFQRILAQHNLKGKRKRSW